MRASLNSCVWLCLSPIAHVLTGFVVAQDWGMVPRATVVPRLQGSFSFLLLIVAVFGTTISPYMFFRQASEEVEKEIEQRQLARPRGLNVTGRLPTIGSREIRRMRVDTWVGMVFSQVTSWFIIITAASAASTNTREPAAAAGSERGFMAVILRPPWEGRVVLAGREQKCAANPYPNPDRECPRGKDHPYSHGFPLLILIISLPPEVPGDPRRRSGPSPGASPGGFVWSPLVPSSNRVG
jgi:hypothetical protein